MSGAIGRWGMINFGMEWNGKSDQVLTSMWLKLLPRNDRSES